MKISSLVSNTDKSTWAHSRTIYLALNLSQASTLMFKQLKFYFQLDDLCLISQLVPHGTCAVGLQA